MRRTSPHPPVVVTPNAREPLDGERLFSVWNWLPAFYVVAQTEHLPTASQRLHVSSSALSRTIRLLEQALGRPLFRRVGRRLQLNSHGRSWLRALERMVGGLISRLNRPVARRGRPSLRVGVVAPRSPAILASTLWRDGERRGLLLPCLRSCRDVAEGSHLLRAGELDLVLSAEPGPDRSLSGQFLAELEYGVFCGRGHPLFGAENPLLRTGCRSARPGRSRPGGLLRCRGRRSPRN